MSARRETARELSSARDAALSCAVMPEAWLPRFLWICLGGALGTGARFLVSEWSLRSHGRAFPYATLIVNLVGSFLIGAVMQAGSSGELLSPTARATLAVGVLGGFTTFSAFSWETLRYLEEGAVARASSYVALSVLGSLAGCAAGIALAKLCTRA